MQKEDIRGYLRHDTLSRSASKSLHASRRQQTRKASGGHAPYQSAGLERHGKEQRGAFSKFVGNGYPEDVADT
jgi:hypothetical protein